MGIPAGEQAYSRSVINVAAMNDGSDAFFTEHGQSLFHGVDSSM
jgi:hypothetical protein